MENGEFAGFLINSWKEYQIWWLLC